MLAGPLIACILLLAAPIQATVESTDNLIAQIITGAKTNEARAIELLDVAKVLTEQPKLRIVVLEKAFEFGIRSWNLAIPTRFQRGDPPDDEQTREEVRRQNTREEE
jgi:hypothetical protein